MKIAVTGKGGVGKTTFSAILARLYANEGKNVLAVDADPDANLGLALGFDKRILDQIVPIAHLKKLVNERTGASEENMGKFFKINPKVDDIPDMYAKKYNGVKLLTLGTVESGGAGCVCPENVLIKRIISHLVLYSDDVVIMDMEAGIEHLGRGTASSVDSFVVVIEPGSRSIQTYEKVKKLAVDLGVDKIKVVANKVRDAEDEAFVEANVPSEDLLGMIHYNTDLIEADRQGKSPFDFSSQAIQEVDLIKNKIDHDLLKV
ncbi:MAG: carbon monoxide dehydrogenase accessory protein CooC [Eubacteriaceae bacterium]|nr:carbon monoxide dehydrogenase accessory protein CooC [Eubacteriaceae bacterium]